MNIETHEQLEFQPLLKQIVEDARRLLWLEATLAKKEMHVELEKAKLGTIWGIISAGFGLSVLVMINFSLVCLLYAYPSLPAGVQLGFPLWACFLIVALVMGIGCVFSYYRAQSYCGKLNFVPRETITSIEEDLLCNTQTKH